ncbi:probable AMP deaminase [Asparagus officinalis]|uniref:probable AMP deaminase n=1 Tax=Asparagus officinalis TaxID=4686 RepID=UPI00098E53DF|nr:probable AMP deaminase [Asparagus officinalis]
MDAYALHLAMAALVGASFVAVSAYYIHRKTLSELLEFARAVERERERDRPEDADRDGEVEAFLSNGHLVDLGIPPGLPRLHTGIEGSKESVCANSTERAGHLIRPISPKSPGASAFESVEGSDDDELPNDVNLDNSYLHANGNHDLPDDIRANGDNNPLPSTSMIRSHSASGDLHGVQPDPVTADILRREPEQETFVRMKISPRGMTFYPFLSYFSVDSKNAIRSWDT